MPNRYHPIPSDAIKVPLPDTIQQKNYSCGAAAIMSISRFFGQRKGLEYEEDFIDMLKSLGMKPNEGTHPYQLRALIKKLKLKKEEYPDMTKEQLISCLDKGRPVIMMLQAYGEDKSGRPLKSYVGVWKEGHWVVAIGYDQYGVFFEDPSLEAIRGFIPYKELDERWHDLGPEDEEIEHYGMEIWKEGDLSADSYLTRAQHID